MVLGVPLATVLLFPSKFRREISYINRDLKFATSFGYLFVKENVFRLDIVYDVW